MALGKMAAEFNDGSRAEVELTYATIIAAERHFGAGLMDLQGRIEAAMWLMWHQLKFSGQHPEIGTFDQWLRTISTFKALGEDGETEAEATVEIPPTEPSRPRSESANTPPVALPTTGTTDGATPPQVSLPS